MSSPSKQGEFSLDIHLLDAGVADENYEKLSLLCQQADIRLFRYDIKPLLEKIVRTGQKCWGDFPSHATWARLFLPEILPDNIDRVLYLYSFVLGLVFRKHIWRIYLVGAAATVLYLLMTSLGFSLLGIAEGNYSNKFAPVSHLLARMLNTPGIEFTDSELETMQEYVDIDELRDSFNPYNMDYSIAAQDVDALKESGSTYLALGLKKALQYPLLTVKHYLILDSFLYSPVPFPDSYVVGMLIETDLWEYKDVYPELAENSKIPWLLPQLKQWSSEYQTASIGNFHIETITMRPAIYFYASLAIIVYLCIKKKTATLWCVILPSAFNLISLAPAMPVSMTRYVYSTILTGYLLIAWFVYELYKAIRTKCQKRCES